MGTPEHGPENNAGKVDQPQPLDLNGPDDPRMAERGGYLKAAAEAGDDARKKDAAQADALLDKAFGAIGDDEDAPEPIELPPAPRPSPPPTPQPKPSEEDDLPIELMP